MATKIFKSGNSRAVRLPKDVDLPVGAEVEVVRSAEGVLQIVPVRKTIDVSGFAGKMPWLQPVEREDWEERELDWDCKRING